jgi:hypothetical protein
MISYHRVATTYRALAALKHEVEMGTVNAHRAVAVRKILSLNRSAPGELPRSGHRAASTSTLRL